MKEETQIQQPNTEATPSTPQEVVSPTPENADLISKMMELGVFYGHSKSRTNPKMRRYILANRSGFNVINLQKTASKLEAAKKLIDKVVPKGEGVLLVGTGPSVKDAVRSLADRLELPYVTERWLGGTLTNFNTISKRVQHLKKLKEEKENNAWEKYTKKEQLDKERELNKLNHLFGGIEHMKKVPGLMVLADVTNNEAAAREAKALDIPTLSIINTDADPTSVTVGIPANDKNIKSVEFIMEQIGEMLEGALKKIKEPKEEKVEDKKENKKDA